MENRGGKKLSIMGRRGMNIYNMLFGRSPCDKCVVNPMCSNGCAILNTWVRRNVHNVKIFGIVIKGGTIAVLISLSGILMNGTHVNILINPMWAAVSLVVIFLSYPTLDYLKFKMLIYFNFKGRLDEHNTEVYNDEQIKL